MVNDLSILAEKFQEGQRKYAQASKDEVAKAKQVLAVEESRYNLISLTEKKDNPYLYLTSNFGD
jgi:proline dehydrogenase